MNHSYKIPNYPANALFGSMDEFMDSWNTYCLNSAEFPIIGPGRFLVL